MADLLAPQRRLLRTTFTGQADGLPGWVQALADGDDAGYFSPGSAAWAVHGSTASTVAGIRALLMQTLHPGAMAGVYDHSRFRHDPLGRLAGTIRWIFTVTYGSTTAARDASDWVLDLHRKVSGSYVDAGGRQRPYSANDPELLGWVHLAFTDSFLRTHQAWGGRIPGGPDAYVREWSTAGRLMQVPDPPTSEAQLRRQLDSHYDAGTLTHSPQVAEAVRFIRDPPLHPRLKIGYRMLFAGAVSTIEPKYRRLLGLKPAALGPVPLPASAAAGAALAGMRLVLGRVGPSEQAARRRLERVLRRSAAE
ncbi:oxygenase MpaB family protein [Arthrobacter castelli]|uniref:oxygenase MpaB family protein n=1 Tax=Arthrobacter castelli TaxID=271431 RepID=UPI00040A59DC|nr:oxygenase MpaB family protein [Arthrobacter castelli]